MSQPENQTQNQSSSEAMAEPAARTETVGEFPTLHRIVDVASRHPVLAVAGIVGAGLIGGAEVAVGVLVGAAVGALVSRGGPPKVVEVAPRTHEVRDRARAMFQALRGKIRVTNGKTEASP